jgi:hypothetical protein
LALSYLAFFHLAFSYLRFIYLRFVRPPIEKAPPPEGDEAYLLFAYLPFAVYSSSSSFKPTASLA